MLIFFNKFDALHTEAFKFYQAIEFEYSRQVINDKEGMIHTPMNIPMGIEGSSDKPYRANAFRLARTVFTLLDRNVNNFKNNVQRAFVDLENYLPESARADEDDVDSLCIIPDKYNTQRLQLIDKCHELTLDMVRFTVSPPRFTAVGPMANLLEYFAQQLVDEKHFGCTPALFQLARTKYQQVTPRLLEVNRTITFWLDLKRQFEAMTSFDHHGVHSSGNLFVDVGSVEDRATKLAKVLLSNLSQDETEALKHFVETKHTALVAAKATLSFNFMAESKAITPAFEAALEVVAPIMPGESADLIAENVGGKRKLGNSL